MFRFRKSDAFCRRPLRRSTPLRPVEALEDRSVPAVTAGTIPGGFLTENDASVLYHLRADDPASVTLAGSAVTGWNDQNTGAPLNFAQGNALKQPTFVGTGFGGNNSPSIQFDGDISGHAGTGIAPNADELILGTSTTPATFIAVNSISTNNGLDGIWGQEAGDLGIRRTNVGAWSHPGNANDFTNPGTMAINGVGGGTVALNTPHILSAVRPVGLGYSQTSIGDYFQVGTNTPRSYGGRVAEVLTLTRALTAPEQQITENSLAAKFGLTLGAGDIYAGDTLAAGDYDRAVIGVNAGLPSVNVALGKTATQSTTLVHGADPEASRAVDGNTNGNFGGNSVTHTDGSDANPWWEVDLGADFPLNQIRLFNRTDCCGDRLSNVTITVTNSANAVVFTSASLNPGNVLGSPALIDFDLYAANGNAVANGRRVRVTRTATAGNVLSLAEVQVFAATPQVNAALGKGTTQSSIAAGGVPSRAVDGNTNGNYGGNSVTHTNAEANPFWIVDLGGNVPIQQVNLFNRTDCCMDRLSDVFVRVLDANNTVLLSSPLLAAGNANPTSPFVVGFNVLAANGGVPLNGSKVRVELSGASKILSLAEVQVITAANFTNAAVGKTAIASSTAFGGVPSRAVDGNTNGNFGGNSVTHTNTEANPFWEVDLGSDTPVQIVNLFNRTDCCGDRLSDVQISVRDASNAVLYTSPTLNPGNILASPGQLAFDVATANGGSPLTGRKVRVTLIGASKILSLAEVQVFTPTPLSASVASAGADGFGIDVAAATDYRDTILAGHKVATNSLVTTDLPAGVASRWDRVWYVDKTDPNNNLGATFTFDFSDAGVSIPGGTIGYQLLYHATNAFESAEVPFTKVVALGTLVGDTVTFPVAASQLADGYYTLGLTTVAPTMPTVYVDDAWTALAVGATIADVDPNTAGAQLGVNGVNAFASFNAGFGTAGAVPSVDPLGTINVRPGAYPETVTIPAGVALNLLGDGVGTPGTASITNLTVNSPTVIRTSDSASNANTLGVTNSGALGGRIEGTGSLAKSGAGVLSVFDVASTSGYLPISPATTTLLTGLTVAQVGGIQSGIMNGAFIGANTTASVFNYSNNGTTATFALAFFDGTFTKSVKVQLSNLSGNVVGTALAARFWNGNVLSPTFNFDTTPGANAQSIATSDGSAGYGVKGLSIGLNSYSGGTNITGGRVVMQSSTALGTGTITLNGGEVERNAAGQTVTNAVTVGAAGGLLVGRTVVDNYVLFSGPFSGTGPLTIQGLVTLNNTANTYAGELTVSNASASYLRLAASEVLGNATNVTLGGANANLRLDGGVTETIGRLQGAAGNVFVSNVGSGLVGLLRFGSGGASSTYSGNFADNDGQMSLEKIGSGTQILTGAGTATTVAVSGGTLRLQGNRAFNAGFFTNDDSVTYNVNATGTLELAGDWITRSNSVYNVRGGTISTQAPGGNLLYINILNFDVAPGLVTGPSGFRTGFFFDPVFTSTVAGSGSTIATGFALFDNGAATNALTVNVANGAAADDLTISGVISTDPSFPGLNVRKTGAGTLTYAGTSANTYTGATTVLDGTLSLDKSDTVTALAAGPVTIGDGVGTAASAVLRVDSDEQIVDTVAVSLGGADGQLFVTADDTETLLPIAPNFAGGDVRIAGELTTTGNYVQGPGTPGTTTLAGGTLRAISTGLGNYDLNDGTLQGTGTVVVTKLTNAATIDPGIGATSAGQITVQGNIDILASGAVNLNVGGTALPDFDQLNATLNPGITPAAINVTNGTVQFRGTLNTGRIGAYVPTNLDFWDVMNFETRMLDTVGVNHLRLPSDFATKNLGPDGAGFRYDPRFLSATNQLNAESYNSSTFGLLGAPPPTVGLAKKLRLTGLSSLASEVTGSTTLTKGGFTSNSTIRHQYQFVTVTNTTGAAINGPIYLEIPSVSLAGVKLYNRAGVTLSAGKEYVVVSPTGLAAGASVAVQLDWLNPNMAAFTYTHRILAGGLP